MPQLSETHAVDIAPRHELDVTTSIQRLVPVLRQFTAEEIDGMRLRLESLLARRRPSKQPTSVPASV